MSNGPSLDTVSPLVERLLAEQRQQWQRGERKAVEAYLEQQPALRDSAEAVLHLVFNEVVLREQQGDSPGLEEYQKRFPELAQELALQFAMDRALQANLLAPSTVLAPTVRAGTSTQQRVAPPPSVPGYETLAELGRGGMGVVYQAWQSNLNRMVALKMILSGAHAGREELTRFRAEAEAAARLQHPNIVQVYDVGEHDGRPYFVLEYVEGGSLERRLAGTPQPAGQAAELIETLARAVHYAHQRGIVHRDLKPANVLLSVSRDASGSADVLPEASRLTECVPKITDFGLAKILVGGRAEHTQTGAVMGTPSYMAPEQARGSGREIGRGTDVYALGAILYELLAGRPPFKGTTAMDTLQQVRSDEPLPPSRLQPRVPRDLETICLKCLQKEPRKRYDSALDLAEDLGRFRSGEPIRARRTPRWERALKWVKRRPMTAALVGVSALATAVVLGLGVQWNQERLHRAEADARAAKRELEEYQRIETMRARAHQELRDGEEALARRDWSAAERHLNQAGVVLADQPALSEMRPEVERRLAEAESGLADQRRYQDFKQLREAVRFYSSQVTGLDAAANRTAIRHEVPKALAWLGITPETAAAPILEEAHFDAAARADIATGCYELLLLLADAVAHPVSATEKPTDQATKALAILDRAAMLRPPTQSYHLLRAHYAAQLGQGPAVKPEGNPADVQPDEAVDHFLRGNERYQRRELRQALAHFQDALHRDPGHFWAQFMIAVCHLRSQRPAEAEAHLSACLSRKPELVWTYLLLGVAHTELGALTPGHEHFQAAEDFFEQARAREQNPDSGYVLLANRGMLRLAEARAARTAGQLRAGAALFPGPLSATVAASDAVAQHKLADAVADFRAAIRLREQQYHAYLNLALAYEEQGRPDAAIAELDHILAGREPAPAEVYRARARLQWKLRHPAAALDDLQHAIDSALRDGASPLLLAEDHKERAVFLIRLERYPEAVRECDEALKLVPDFATAHRLRGETLHQLGQLKEAIASYDRYLALAVLSWSDFLRRKEPLAEIYRGRGLAHWKLRNPSAALDDYGEALRLEPTAAGHAFRGWIYLEIGSPALGRAEFEKAICLDPKNAEAHAGRGFARIWIGHVDEAVADARRALELGRLLEPASGEDAKRTSERARLAYNLARVYAQAAGRSEAGPLRLTYQAQAVQLVRAALDRTPAAERLPFWRDIVAMDRALDPIRRSLDFMRLAAAYARPTG
jgi:serine/threonine protein kinase/predicted Zn-dependent protease